jgi:uncharacterized protein YndB with AHSA1/START domain
LNMTSTRIVYRMNAPPEAVYRALLDARAVAKWMVPNGMTSHVHDFEPREGGSFRISLTYEMPTGTGKTSAQTDTFHGRFVKLAENRQVVQVVEFETHDPAMRGEMTITCTLTDAEGGTDVLWSTTEYRAAFHPPTTNSVHAWRSRNSRRWSRPVRIGSCAPEGTDKHDLACYPAASRRVRYGRPKFDGFAGAPLPS